MLFAVVGHAGSQFGAMHRVDHVSLFGRLDEDDVKEMEPETDGNQYSP